jgi:hypothetical protein
MPLARSGTPLLVSDTARPGSGHNWRLLRLGRGLEVTTGITDEIKKRRKPRKTKS